MSYPMRRWDDNALAGREGLGHRPIPARVERRVNRAVAVEHGRGIVWAAQVRAIEYVAAEALQATCHLARLEAFYAHQVPHATGRLQAIAELAAMNMADIVAETGR